MCWIDESDDAYRNGRGSTLYDADLSEYRSLVNSLNTLVVKSGCLVPETDWRSPCDIDNVLPFDYSPPAEISITTCGDDPDQAQMISDFNNIRNGMSPDCVLLIVDYSGSLDEGEDEDKGAIELGYTNFKNWLDSNYPGTKIEATFDDEQWIKAINTEISNIIYGP